MKKQWKRCLALICASLMVFGLVSCATGAPPVKKETTGTTVAEKKETAKATEQTTAQATKAAPTGIDPAARKEMLSKLIINKDPATLTAEERGKGYQLYFPIGAKFLYPESYAKSNNVKRSNFGVHGTESDAIYCGRAYYFRSDAMNDLFTKIRNDEKDTDKRNERIVKEVKPFDVPLFGIYNFYDKNLKGTLEEAKVQLGYDKVEILSQKNGITQVYMTGKMDAEKLPEAEQGKYKDIYRDLDIVRASLQYFPAQKAQETLPQIRNWGFKATTLDGKPLDESVFKNADLTYVVYWATWCPDCHHELKVLGEMKPKLEAMGVQVVGFVSDLYEEKKGQGDDAKVMETANKLMKDSGCTFVNAFNSNALEAGIFRHTMNVPTCMLVDRNGNVLKAYVEPDGSKLEGDAAALLAQIRKTASAPQGQAPQAPAAPAPTDAPKPTFPEWNSQYRMTPISEIAEEAGCSCGKN